MEKISSKIEGFTASIMSMEVVYNNIWLGMKDGTAIAYDQNKQKVNTITVGSTMILSILFAQDLIWFSCADNAIRVYTARVIFIIIYIIIILDY